MTCSPVEEHHQWGVSSTEAASPEDFMAIMYLEIKMGKYEKVFGFCQLSSVGNSAASLSVSQKMYE